MKTIEVNIYQYNELSEEAKEKVKQWLLDDDSKINMYSEQEKEYYANEHCFIETNVQFQFNHVQGDYFKIKGTIDLADLLEKYKSELLENQFTEHDLKTLNHVFEVVNFRGNIDANNYSQTEIELDDIENIDYYNNYDYIIKTWEKFKDFIIKKIDKDIKQSFEGGYKYFYEISEEDAKETCEINDYWFYENGDIY